MKKFHLLVFTLFSFLISNSQSLLYTKEYDLVTFEDTSKISKFIKLDTNSGNIWRIGKPSKLLFDSAYSIKNAIVTNLKGYYSSNAHSSFILKFFSRFDAPYELDTSIWFSGYYKIDSDSLKDYGIIEMSMDNGQNWINLKDYWYKGLEKPVFTGNLTDKWHYFLFWHNSYFAYHSIDSLWFRFTFISDSIDNNKEGWIIDNLEIKIILPDLINEIHKDRSFILTPNPVQQNDDLTILFDNLNVDYFTLYNCNGMLLTKIIKPSNPLIFNTTQFKKGLYYILIMDNKGKSSVKKLVIN